MPAATQAFFRLPLLESWFAAVRRLLLELRPACLLLTSFVALSGAAALPEILGLPTRVVMAHTIPMHPTGEFGVPLAGTGFSAPAAWLNRLQWRSLDVAVARTLHLPRAQAIVDGALGSGSGGCAAPPCAAQPALPAAAGGVAAEACSAAAADLDATRALLVSRTRLGHRDSNLAAAAVPTLYIWSPALLPKPGDWPPNCLVVGPLLLRRPQPAPATPRRGSSGSGDSSGEAADPLTSRQQGTADAVAPAPAAAPAELPVGLPAGLQEYLDGAARRQLPVVYIGLGSMLATVFEAEEVGRRGWRRAGWAPPLLGDVHAMPAPSSMPHPHPCPCPPAAGGATGAAHGRCGGACGGRGAALCSPPRNNATGRAQRQQRQQRQTGGHGAAGT